MAKIKSKSLPRREFLKAAGATGAAAGVAAVALSGGSTVKAAVPNGGSKSGYRETDHVKKYYELSRF